MGQNPRGGGGESISERINSSREKRIKITQQYASLRLSKLGPRSRTFSLRLMQALVSCPAWHGGMDRRKPGVCRTIMETRMRTTTTIQLSAALVRDSPIVLSVLSGDPGHGFYGHREKNAYSKHGTRRAMRTQRFLISPSVAFISSYLGSKSGGQTQCQTTAWKDKSCQTAPTGQGVRLYG